MRRMPVKYSVSKMARSRTPRSSSTSAWFTTCSASAALSTCLGKRFARRGRSSSLAGFASRTFCRVSHLKYARTGTSRVCWLRKLRGFPFGLR